MGQDTLTFLNGKVITGTVTNTDSLYITYKPNSKWFKKAKTVSSESIFDIKHQDGSIDTIYYLSPELEQFLSVDEMHLYILGEQDAAAYYQPKLTAILGVAFGAGMGYLLRDGFYVAGVPLVYTIGAGISKIKIKNVNMRPTSVLSTIAYQEGFIRKARAKKAFIALGSSFIGTGLGIIIGNASAPQ